MSGLNSALTPSRIIEYLNRYIVGQDKACLLYTSDAADEL